MPDWSYRTVLRPLMLSYGHEPSRRFAIAALRMMSRIPGGLGVIEFLGHMHADERLHQRVAGVDVQSPIALGALIDPAGDAVPAFSCFGAGIIEVGPVVERATTRSARWNVDVDRGVITSQDAITVSVDDVCANLERSALRASPVCVHIGEQEFDAVRRIAERLRNVAAIFAVDAPELVRAAAQHGPVLVRVSATSATAADIARRALDSGAAGIWVADADDAEVRALRKALPASAAIVAQGLVKVPADAWRLIDAGADVVILDAGLICGGPGLVKRCNEAVLATVAPPPKPEPLSLDAGRRSWFWALLLGAAMSIGGVMATVIGSTRIIMPYDESLCGLTRAQMVAINPRLLPFMAHDRLSLAGTMLSIGILYMALAWCGVRRGEAWARAAVVASASAGFLTFFYFLGFEYFDPFHAFVTAILTQFTLLCVAMPPSPRQLPAGDWIENAAWRRGQWGQLLFIVLGAALTGAGIVISIIGCTRVFVDTDLAFLRTTAAQLRVSYERLVPLVAHDRATLGGMLIANGIVTWLAAQWGMRAGSRWLWTALCWSGNTAFALAVAVHFVVGYGSPLHLAPAILGWLLWNTALLLTHGWLTADTTERRIPSHESRPGDEPRLPNRERRTARF